MRCNVNVHSTLPHSLKGRIYSRMCPMPTHQDTQCLLIGGCLGDWDDAPCTAWTFDVATSEWHEHRTYGENPLPLAQHSLDVIDDCNVAVVGGFSRRRPCSPCVFSLNVVTWEWQQRGRLPRGVYAHSTLVDRQEQKLYIFGGSDHRDAYGEVYGFDLLTNFWFLACPISTIPRRLYHSGLTVRRPGDDDDATPAKMYVHGGAPDPSTTTPDSVVFDDLWSFDCRERRWSRLAPIPSTASSMMMTPSRRGSTVFCHIEPFLFLYSGFDGTSALGDAYLYDLDLGHWVPLQLDAPSHFKQARFGSGCCALSTGLVVAFSGATSVEFGSEFLTDLVTFELCVDRDNLKFHAARWLLEHNVVPALSQGQIGNENI
eukprot:PhM_4_TR6112/c0_g1_i1/m.59335